MNNASANVLTSFFYFLKLSTLMLRWTETCSNEDQY